MVGAPQLSKSRIYNKIMKKTALRRDTTPQGNNSHLRARETAIKESLPRTHPQGMQEVLCTAPMRAHSHP